MKVTLNEVEGIIAMYLEYIDFIKSDLDFTEKRLQYWNEIKKKLLED